jgi:hypothetical protein
MIGGSMKYLAILLLFFSETSLAKERAKTKVTTPPERKQEATKVNSSSEDGYTAVPSTKIDFSETSIDGKMKAPEGFFLQGRQSQSLAHMVKLRSNFRNELRNSRAAVRSIVK